MHVLRALQNPRLTGPCLALAAGWLGFLAISCGEPSQQALAPLAAAPAYRVPVSDSDSERCADCHGEVVASWNQTGMARSLGPVRLGELDQLGQVADGASGYRYQYARSPESSAHVLAETHAKHPRHALGTAVVLGIGSGELDRSYALRYGTSLRFSPLEVLPTQQGRRSALAPGHMMRSGLRFETPITNECLACHTDRLPAKRFPLDLEPDSSWQPRGISCAACHRGSAAHADWQEGEATGDDPILRHASLVRSQQLSVCAACHLQGDARVSLNPDPEAVFQAGQELLEQRAVFVAATPSSEVGFVSHVARLSLAQCFLQSSMTCSSCHDPHRSLHQETERQRVRQACGSCHANEGMPSGWPRALQQDLGPACSRVEVTSPAGTDCVSCHMPRVGSFDVAGVLIHDHHIRKRVPRLSAPRSAHELRVLESQDARLRRFSWPWQPAPAEDAGLSMLAYASAKLESQALKYLEQPASQATQHLPLYQHLRGLLLELKQAPKQAEDAYLRALELDPGMASSTINLASLMAAGGRPREAYLMLTELLERHPQAEGALRNRALIAMQLGRSELFAGDLEKAFFINPSSSLAATLARFYASRGDALSEGRWWQLALDLDPNLTRR